MMRGISIFLDDTAPAEAPARAEASGRGAAKNQSTARDRERLAILQRLQDGAIDANAAAALLDALERK
jgi:hypothetical protein